METLNGHSEAFTRPQYLHHIKQGSVQHRQRGAHPIAAHFYTAWCVKLSPSLHSMERSSSEH